jgi:glycosyltransferase involved in cell wall biosynthesis
MRQRSASHIRLRASTGIFVEKLSIIIPAYNEAKTIRKIVEKIFTVSFPIEFEVVIVDDHSQDRTFRIAGLLEEKRFSGKIRLYRNDINRGKGYSIRKGFEVATGSIFIVQDADFEYDPDEIPKLLAPILENQSQVVYGSRFLKVRHPSGMGILSWMANQVLTSLTNWIYGSRLTDMETCYKLFRSNILTDIPLSAKRFDFEPEITAKFLRKGLDILELPIAYNGRSYEEGKKIKARDFFFAVWALLRYRFID